MRKQMTRKTLEKPEAEIILFREEDIVTESHEFVNDEYEDNPIAG